MTSDEILKMANDAGIIPWTLHEYVGKKRFSAMEEGLDGDMACLVQFAVLIAAAEREACAKACDELDTKYESVCQMTSVMCSQAIRARGQA